jgi:hypothetical protein
METIMLSKISQQFVCFLSYAEFRFKKKTMKVKGGLFGKRKETNGKGRETRKGNKGAKMTKRYVYIYIYIYMFSNIYIYIYMFENVIMKL